MESSDRHRSPPGSKHYSSKEALLIFQAMDVLQFNKNSNFFD